MKELTRTKVFAQNKYPRTSIPVQLARLLRIRTGDQLIWMLGRDEKGRYFLKVYRDPEPDYWKQEAKLQELKAKKASLATNQGNHFNQINTKSREPHW